VSSAEQKKNMTRQLFSLALGALLLALCSSVDAQLTAKAPRIGWLGFAGPGTRIGLFRRELRGLGYVEGSNITIEVRTADDKIDRLRVLAEELTQLKVDVIVAPSTPGAMAAKSITRTIPIVFIGSADPVTAGLVDSLARPGGNVTGFTTIGSVLAGKRLELLKETDPNLSRVAVLWNSDDPTSFQQWKESQLPARDLDLQLHSMEVRSTSGLENAFKAATKARSTALAVTHSAPFVSARQRIAELAIKNRLPGINPRGDFVISGGLISYGGDEVEPYKRAASIVDRILKGAKPADLPVEQPTKFELVINLKTAKQIGLTIPPNVLARADRVIR
jgi:putative tryptophan/tyrosine transport system substrate-binding protein